jgi:hypothetical protein
MLIILPKNCIKWLYLGLKLLPQNGSTATPHAAQASCPHFNLKKFPASSNIDKLLSK